MPIIRVDTEDLVSVQDAARELSRPRITIYRMIDRGDIAAIKLGGVIYIPRSEIERLKFEAAKRLREEEDEFQNRVLKGS